LEVRSALLDEIMPKPEQPELDCVIVTEAKVSLISSFSRFSYCTGELLQPQTMNAESYNNF